MMELQYNQDDLNNIQFDGCYKCQYSCQLECLQCVENKCYQCFDGWKLIDYSCYHYFGDGQVSSMEQFDDGNYDSGDGCFECKYQCIQYCNTCINKIHIKFVNSTTNYIIINVNQYVEMNLLLLDQKNVQMVMIFLMMVVLIVNFSVENNVKLVLLEHVQSASKDIQLQIIIAKLIIKLTPLLKKIKKCQINVEMLFILIMKNVMMIMNLMEMVVLVYVQLNQTGIVTIILDNQVFCSYYTVLKLQYVNQIQSIQYV
ncbi:unnamed protein product [Paramecium primaurelia]|uniref:Transmembrane protein n=1 Tax=Paramecium primaurelia TaxID=5886 RepID=A0A8S1QLI5_PARPR|nr:unnamed protein product [Paramecium primaurelia]